MPDLSWNPVTLGLDDGWPPSVTPADNPPADDPPADDPGARPEAQEPEDGRL
jgi:hypothetical protein